MSQPIRIARRPGRALLVALAGGLLASCSDSDALSPSTRVVALQVISRNPHPGVAGHWLPDSVRVRAVDAQGKGVYHANVLFRGGVFSPESGFTDADGYVQTAWRLGDAPTQAATVHFPDLAPVALNARTVQVPATVQPVLGLLSEYLERATTGMINSLPLNPQAAPFFEAKLAILRTPGLGGDIVDGHRYVQGRVTSISGAEVPITAVFPLEAMRDEAAEAVRTAEATLPVLEAFLGQPYAPSLRIWYGFVVGSSGGGGTVAIEDRTTYNARTQGRFQPYGPVIAHEMGHTFIGHETLNQFLELYGYNVVVTGSTDPGGWLVTRSWVPGRAENTDIHAILDIYQLIGPQAMSTAYRAILPLQPRYGQPLASSVAEAFAAAVPEAVRPQVAAKLARVGY